MRNSVESFVSLNNKVFLCGRYNYMLKLLYGSMEEFIKIRKVVLMNDYGKEDYPGATNLKEQLAENLVIRRLGRKLQQVEEFVTTNKAVFDRFEAKLHAEQYEISAGTMEAIQSYLMELRVFHTAADNLLAIHLKLHERAKITRNAVQLLDSFNQEKYNNLDRSGRASDIKKLPVTPIELFKDGDMFWVKVKCKDQGRGRGWLATLESAKVNINLGLLE